jgi:hypothetical protein
MRFSHWLNLEVSTVGMIWMNPDERELIPTNLRAAPLAGVELAFY